MNNGSIGAVLNVSQNYRVLGGSDTYFFALEDLLRRRGHTVIPFAAAHPDNAPSEWSAYFPRRVDFERPGIFDIARFLYSRPAAASMNRLLENAPVSVAHLHIYYGQITASILRPLRRAGVPIVQTLHEYKVVCPVYTMMSNGKPCDECEGKHFWRAVKNRCNRGSLARSALSAAEAYTSKALGAVDHIDHFIAVSDFVRENVVKLGLPPEKVTTVHNFLDASAISPSASHGDYFLYLGRLDRLKGIFTLLEAASGMKDIPLLVAGEGAARPELEKLVGQNGLRHVRLLGFQRREHLAELIGNSICTVAPSQCNETFGLSLAESFAHGRPVIASDVGGVSEVVDDGVNGFLVPPGDSGALREQMLWMARHPAAAVKMGLAGRRKVEARFDPETHYQKIMKVYEKVLKR